LTKKQKRIQLENELRAIAAAIMTSPKPKHKVKKRTAKIIPFAAIEGGKKSFKISGEALAHSRRKPRETGASIIAIDEARRKAWQPAKPPPGAHVPSNHKIAFDNALIEVSAWGAATALNGAFSNGAAFIGYPILSELAQIAEYRKIISTIATQMTRKFIKLSSASKVDDKSERIKKLTDAIDSFKVKDIFRRACEVDGFFGRAHIYLDTGNGHDRDELKTDIGNGRNDLSKMKATEGQKLRRLKVVEPIWTYPSRYDASDPLTTDWYNPETWFVQGKELHRSRLLPMVGREVPDMLKPAYSFGGLAMTQMAMPYVNNWLRTRQSVADLIWSFSTSGISTDLNTYLAPGAGTSLDTRMELFNNYRNNRGIMILNKETEEFFQHNTPLGTLDMLLAQSQEQMASVASIPLIFLLGISPHGLNATAEPEIKVFYDSIHAYQEQFYRPMLTVVLDFIQLAIWGVVDQDIIFGFEPLFSLDEKAIAEVQKTRAETDDLLINGGILHPGEARKRIASDPDSEYPDIDVGDIPEPPAEEIGGESLDPGKSKDEPNGDVPKPAVGPSLN